MAKHRGSTAGKPDSGEAEVVEIYDNNAGRDDDVRETRIVDV